MKKIKSIYIVLVLLLCNTVVPVFAQEVESIKEETIQLSGSVTDVLGNQLEHILVYSPKTDEFAFSDKDGKFSIESGINDFLVFTSKDYEKRIAVVQESQLNNPTVVMQPFGIMNPKQKVSVSNGTLTFDRITGSVERITGEELTDYPTLNIYEALAGRLSGVESYYGTTSPDWESHGIRVRGNGLGSTYVNGVKSKLEETATEIEDIIIAKDFASTFMFGIEANGAILVNTKKGNPGEKLMSFRVRRGVRTPTFTPDMMNSYQYANAINTALENDGLPSRYSQDELDQYLADTSSVRYPNHDYYSELMDETANYTHATAEFSGGGNRVQYFSHLGYYNTTGIESVGAGRNQNRIRLRNTVNIKFSNFGSLTMGIGGSFKNTKMPLRAANDIYSTMYNYPANAMPYMLNDTIYANSYNYSQNLMLDVADGSIKEDTRRDGYTQIGLDLDLGQITEGLSFNSQVSMYIYNSISKRLDPIQWQAKPVWETNSNGVDTLLFEDVVPKAKDNQYSKTGDNVVRNQSITSSLNYDREFSENSLLTANLIYSQREETGNYWVQGNRLRNIGLRANYMFNQKYVLDFQTVNSSIRQLSDEENKRLFYDYGAAYLAHKGIFSDVSWLNFLKLRANYGAVGQGVSTYFLDATQYSSGGAGTFGVANDASGSGGYVRSATGATNIVYPERAYLNIGADFQLFNSKFSGQVNYFKKTYTNQLTKPTNVYALVPSAYIPYTNYEESEARGVDGRISYRNNVGKFHFLVDVNAMYRETYVTKANEVLYPETELLKTGNLGGRILGLEADGIFQNQEEVDAALPQYFGTVKPGDIRYKDYNEDGIIDSRDRHEIGHSPRWYYGANLRLRYGNLTLSMHGDGIAGGEYTNSRSWNRKYNNYPVEMDQAWPVSNTLPRLTTESNSNNYQNSTFWLKKRSYFNLRSVTLNYDLSDSFLLTKTPVRRASIFVSGKNLALLQQNNDYYLPSTNSGLTETPVLNAFEFGLEVDF